MPRRDKNIARSFFKMYHRMYNPRKTNTVNYEMAERVYKKREGERCFKNYQSFRKSLSYHKRLKKEREN